MDSAAFCTPTPREQGKARPQNKKEQPVGLHFDFARRLPQSYILKLLDRPRNICFFELSNGGSLPIAMPRPHPKALPAQIDYP
jgi:hypothetical protein